MKAIIAQFYKTANRATKRAEELKRVWRGKIAWYVLEARNGYFVISETQARLCGIETKLKDRRY